MRKSGALLLMAMLISGLAMPAGASTGKLSSELLSVSQLGKSWLVASGSNPEIPGCTATRTSGTADDTGDRHVQLRHAPGLSTGDRRARVIQERRKRIQLPHLRTERLHAWDRKQERQVVHQHGFEVRW